MKFRIQKILLLLLASLSIIWQTGCTSNTSVNQVDFKDILEQISQEFNIQDISYLVSKNGEVSASKYTNVTGVNFSLAKAIEIIKVFSNPIKLDLLIKDSMIPGDSSLSKYFPAINNKGLNLKDLVIVPADNWEPQRFCADSVQFMTDIIANSKAKTKKGSITNELIAALEKSNDQLKDNKALLEKLFFISDFFDRNYMEYASMQDSLVTNLFPTWYTENKSFFYGWKILRIQKNTILWNCFFDGERTLLLLKFMDKDVFTAISYKSKNIPDPTSYNRDDLLQSPIALALIRSVLLPEGKQINIDYRSQWNDIKDKINLIGDNAYRFIYTKDLIAHARYYESLKDVKNAQKLYLGYAALTQDSLLLKYVNEMPIAETGYISDNLNSTAAFSIEKEGYYQIFSGGQVLQVSDYNTAPYNSDNIQLFISQYNNVNPSRAQFQVFHFNYRFNKIAGKQDDRHADNWLKGSNIKFTYSDPDDTSYVLEVAIPWKEIHGKEKHNTHPLRLNIFIGDSDYEENKRESIYSWATKPGEGWDDPSTYGVLSFTGEHRSLRKIYASKPIAEKIIIDGQIDDIWNKVDYSMIELPIYDKVSAYDNISKFKSLYDNEYLYFLFYVGDNCKNKTGIITKDKCWIEDASTNQLIWKLPADTTGYMPSYSIETKVYLKAGKYKLRYYSDKGHSFEGWYGTPPYHDIYGGTIYAIKN